MKFDIGALPARLGKKLQRLVGSANQRFVNAYSGLVAEVNRLADATGKLTDEEVRARMAALKEEVQAGKRTLDQVKAEVFALVRVASERTLGLRHYDVQLIGGAVLHDGRIAEMATGEGKTLVATLPAALNALSGKGVYVVTVNDYLAKRDRDWMAPVFEFLGLTVGAIQSNMPPAQRKQEYECDITYGTNNEFGFDYLRDNMKWRTEEQVQTRLNFAIVDEVDSILIDEARTPLIISGPPEGKADKFVVADRISRQLKEGEHFEVKLKEQSCLLTDEGIEKAEKLAGVDSFYANPANMDWPHLLECSLRAHYIYEVDKNYVVRQNEQTGESEVVIVDEFTGRLMSGRRWSDGLHQAVEAKEGLTPKEENQVLATITLQNYFRMFDKLAGMTGTAMTEAAEFARIYKLDVVAIPTNRPMVRQDSQDQIYLDDASKLVAIVEEIKEAHEVGRPILVGTTSIAKSEALSRALTDAGIEHNVLNAKQHEREAEIVAMAGRKGRVTVATNMAGRGTDIVLGGNPEFAVARALHEKGLDPDSEDAAAVKEEVLARCKAEQAHVLSVGGLLVMGTERHEARRIDNQLRGRCGRQGDPGATKFFLSFDDDLMRIFARDWVRTMMEKLGLKPGERIESPMVSRGIARAQKKVESRNFDIRKHLIEYDEVMDKQRRFIYGQRQEILKKRRLDDKILGMFEDRLEPMIKLHSGDKDEPVAYDEITSWMQHKCGSELDLAGMDQVPRDELFDWLMEKVERQFATRKQEYGSDDWQQIEQFLLLDTIDNKWKDHLHAMEVLKAGIGLRSYAQVDPKNEYKREGYEKFEMLKAAIADRVTDLAFKVEIKPAQAAPQSQPERAQQAPPKAVDAITAQAMLEAMMASHHLPAEVIDAVRRGAEGAAKSATPPQGGRSGSPNLGLGGIGGRAAATPVAAGGARPAPVGAAVQSSAKKAGRNDPCPCGSGIKYKKCCHPAFG